MIVELFLFFSFSLSTTNQQLRKWINIVNNESGKKNNNNENELSQKTETLLSELFTFWAHFFGVFKFGVYSNSLTTTVCCHNGWFNCNWFPFLQVNTHTVGNTRTSWKALILFIFISFRMLVKLKSWKVSKPSSERY